MEGPSVHALADELQPLVGQRIQQVRGNARQPIDELAGRRVQSVEAVKKQLVIDCGEHVARVHFLMHGTWRLNERRDHEPRLALVLDEDEFNTYHCSAKVWTDQEATKRLDPTGDVLREAFDAERARRELATDRPVVDVLLDQQVFGGVGNIVKNEALFRARVPPTASGCELSERERERVFEHAVGFTWDWYERGGPYPARRGLRIYRAGRCPRCGTDVTRQRLGEFDRITFSCPACQRLHREPAKPPVPPARAAP